MDIGNKIKKVRELRNFTQEYIAHELGITQESYSRIEANKASVTLQRLEKIAEVLTINVFDLLSFDEKIVFNNINNSFEPRENAKIIFVNQGEKDFYERIIEQQKAEIDFLRSLLKDKI